MEKQSVEFSTQLEEEIAKVKAEQESTSMSSGEKIESVSPPESPPAATGGDGDADASSEKFSTPAANEDDDEDDDGWGDDGWGSDDDL